MDMQEHKNGGKKMKKRKEKLTSSEKKQSHSQRLHWSLGLVAERYIHHDIRYSAALDFNNHVKAHWSPPPVSDSNPIAINPISDVEKENIKSLIVSVMIKANSPKKIQSQLSEALYVIIGHHDFPKEWPALLPEIVAQLRVLRRSSDYASINLLLGIVNSLFMKFRCTFKTNDLLVDLKYCLHNFAKPLLEVFKRTASLIDRAVASGAAKSAILNPYIESQRLCCCIFYSLNFQELPKFFKDHMCEWMDEFKKCLRLKYPAHVDFVVDGHLLDELRAAVCENIILYVIEEEDLFQGNLSGFVEDVVNHIVGSSSHCREQLAVTAIKLLTTVSKSGHHALLSSDDVLEQICERIVIPNVMLQDEEEELFETDPIEFIKKDMEGSSIDTRRGIVSELLNGIAMHYKDKVRYQLEKCWKLYASNTKGNWKYKDCVIRLIVSRAAKNADETCVSSDLVDVQSFFDSYVVQDLDMRDAISFPMITAGVLKLLTLFRNQISKDSVLPVLPDISRLLNLPNQVIHSYAAICIEKLLLIKDDKAGTWRYTPDDIRPILRTLMSDLFGALSNPKSEENQYVIECIMHVVCVGDLTVDVASLCIEGLTIILHKVCQNPKSSLFNRYLFESLTALIRRVSVLSRKTRNKIEPLEKKISLVSQLEKKLYPCLQMILARDIRELFPYAFWLLAELADLNRPLLSKHYTHIFDVFRLPDTWTRSGNYPETAFLKWTPPPPPMHRLSMIGIYNKLVLSSATKDYGFNVLNTVIEHLGFEVISAFVRNIWIFLFNRLQNKRRVKSVKNSIVLMSLFLLKDGPRNLVNSVNAVQPNAFQAMLRHVWIPNLELITCPIELKLTCVASTRLICECPDILDIMLWGKMLDNIMTLVSRQRVDDEPEIPEFGETMADHNATTFAALIYKARKNEKEENPSQEINDPRQYLVVSLSNLFAASPHGKKYYHQVINECLEKSNQTALLQLFSSYSVSFS